MFNRKRNESDVFQEITRKMKYGAPELKKFYNVFLIRGLAVAIITASIIALSSFKYINSHTDKSETNLNTPERSIVIKDAYVEIPLLEVPVIDNQVQVPLKDLSALTPEPVAKRNVKEDVTLKNQNELENVKLPVSSEGTEDPSEVTAEVPGKIKIDEVKIDENIEKVKEPLTTPLEIYQVEKSPAALNLNSIKALMKYPSIALSTGTEGRVTVRVLVGTDGSVIKIGSISGPEVFRDEVKENVMGLQFTPAMMNDQTVKCWVSVPFSFKLNNK